MSPYLQPVGETGTLHQTDAPQWGGQEEERPEVLAVLPQEDLVAVKDTILMTSQTLKSECINNVLPCRLETDLSGLVIGLNPAASDLSQYLLAESFRYIFICKVS